MKNEQQQESENIPYVIYDYKVALLEWLFHSFAGKEIRVLNMGAGTSKQLIEILKQYPNIHYTAVEYSHSSQQQAREALQHLANVQFLEEFGEQLTDHYTNYFDITLSLSVLEHVKYWQAFLSKSVQVTKAGGKIIHRYDLGHALHGSWYEKLKVRVCQHMPFLIPKEHFTFYPDQAAIISILQAEHVQIDEIQYAQIPNLKGMMNRIRWGDTEAVHLSQMIIELERFLSRYMKKIVSTEKMEKYFPAITIIGTKQV